jgi:ubiquinone/menaquinone biosynthesis C-methylase UbiE
LDPRLKPLEKQIELLVKHPHQQEIAMNAKRFSIRDWAENLLLSLFFKQYYPYERVALEVKDFASDGPILDIGGGGEGVIGRLKGSQVVAIDLYQEELDEAPVGPQKIVMDARQLTFPEDSFGAATAFFSLMYMKTRQDHEQVMQEARRVLKPMGHLLVWEIDLAERPATSQERYMVRLRYRVGDLEKGTAYGARWPNEARGEAYYRQLAREAGFEHLTTERTAHLMFLEFIKPG